MAGPLVSVCIPVKSMARTICQTVESAIAQPYDNIEVLVVDNCSEDETLELVSAFRDPRIKVVRNETDVGVYGNHNRCVELARGEFLKFLHGDDLLKADCVERMLEPFRGTGGEQIGLVACGAVELDQAGVEFRWMPVHLERSGSREMFFTKQSPGWGISWGRRRGPYFGRQQSLRVEASTR